MEAKQVLDLPRDRALAVIDGLIELADHCGGGRGFRLVLEDGVGALDDTKYSGDRYAEGLDPEALQVIAEIVQGR